MKKVYFAIAILFAISESSCNKCITCEINGQVVAEACSADNEGMYENLKENGYSDENGYHTDCAMRRVEQQPGAYVRADVSATLFLSDPEDYDGGVLTIEDSFGAHGVKLAAGSLVVYPSSSIHAVTPVTRGERVACFMFIQSMVRDAGQRRLLYDMDMALLDLREQYGEIDPVVRLTGIYHNLLRRWADS